MFIYLIRTIGTDLYKIGISKNPKARLEHLQTGNGCLLEIIFTFKTVNSFQLESSLHNQFKNKKTTGEWFEFLSKEVEEFKSRCSVTEKVLTKLKELDNPFV